MSQGPVFLIGGGWNEPAFPHTYGRFVAALSAASTPRIACVLLDGDERDDYFARSAAAFAAVGFREVDPVFVSPERPLRADDLTSAAGVFVGGGLTPAYYDAVLPTAGEWLPWLRDCGILYAGFSAGAMVAPTRGIIGGWKVHRNSGGATDLVICAEEVGEDEEFLDIRPGLGLVPFAVDVHASQWGTVTRLLHAVRLGLVQEGWAIDEDTMIEVDANRITVHGLGSAYHVQGIGESLAVEILGAGEYRGIGTSSLK